MPTSLAVLHVFGGVVYLLMAGDLLVRGAVALSRKLGISAVVVGLTVVAFGTSAPELVVSVRAALVGYPELAIGNVVGSNIANVLLVVGVPAMVYPMVCDQPGIGRDGSVMLFVSVLFFVLCAGGALGAGDGLILLGGLALFLAYVIRSSSLKAAWTGGSPVMERVLGLPSTPGMIGVFLLLGVVGLPLGAELLIRGAVGVAESLGVPQSVIGLTMVALGTSVPELATTLVAAFQREPDVAVGNILGSNVLNLLAIMGIAAVVSPEPVPIPGSFLVLDLPVMLAAAAALAVITIRGGTVTRGLGGALFGAYVVYVLLLFRTVV